jgi:hypothetical protein
MESLANKFSHIPGWGIDADPKNDPTYPMKDRSNAEQTGYSWDRPTLQPESVEVLQSIERPNITAVFGTSTPPSGLSGQIRRYAFKYSENHYGHWLPLILADRVNVVEGIIDDIRHGHFPNIFAEKGLGAEWKHDKKAFATRVVVTAVATTLVFGLLFRSDKPKKNRRRRLN